MAHRLELAIQHSFDVEKQDLPHLGKYMDNMINSLYSFYNDKTHKRKTHLKNTANRLYKDRKGKRYYELIYIFNVRWIASNYKAMTKIKNMLEAIIVDLGEITEDSSFTGATREKARVLRENTIERKFLLFLHFLLDVVYELNRWSLRLQERSGVLIDFLRFKRDITTTFHMMKNDDSRQLNAYLNEVLCKDNNGAIEKCGSVAKYEASPYVLYHNIELIRDGREGSIPTLSAVRETYLSSLIDELESYFPDGHLEDFGVLSPERMPKPNDQPATRFYGLTEIRNLENLFGLDVEATIDDWQTLLESIVKSNNYCKIKRDEAESVDFWATLMSWKEIIWGRYIEKLIKIVLVLPISSAEAERGFSVLNHVRNDRKKLLGSNLEDILRIKLNGPTDLNKFGAAKYAKKWINEGHMRTDDPSGRRKVSYALDENEENKKYTLYRSSIF